MRNVRLLSEGPARPAALAAAARRPRRLPAPDRGAGRARGAVREREAAGRARRRGRLPEEVGIAGETFHVDRTIDRVSQEVTLVRSRPDEAGRQLETGRVVAVVTIPQGFLSELNAMVRSPKLQLETTRGGLAPRVRSRCRRSSTRSTRSCRTRTSNEPRLRPPHPAGRARGVRRAVVRRARPRGDRAAAGRAPAGAAARPDPRVRRHGAACARPDGLGAARDRASDRARAGAGARPDVGALRPGAGVRARARDDAPRAAARRRRARRRAGRERGGAARARARLHSDSSWRRRPRSRRS